MKKALEKGSPEQEASHEGLEINRRRLRAADVVAPCKPVAPNEDASDLRLDLADVGLDEVELLLLCRHLFPRQCGSCKSLETSDTSRYLDSVESRGLAGVLASSQCTSDARLEEGRRVICGLQRQDDVSQSPSGQDTATVALEADEIGHGVFERL